MQIGVDDGHVGEQLIIGQRIFNSALFIGYYCKGSDLAARSGRGGDGNELSLFAHLGESVNTLADIHETHGNIHEVHIVMLVHHPHDLSGVHRGTAA